ncbi:F-box only protein 15 isoform X3 [Esox lucius]|uniref:F-box only protein 15 isoform X3 n=1 Tax=Esox lucius TaxID=8010 RepID=UPI001476DC06|nr:F-box only protein 15 isoform X3 [Esox lucius]
MAIGRGQLFRSFREGLLKNAPPTECEGPKGKDESDRYDITGFSPDFQCVGPEPLRQKCKKKAAALSRPTGYAVMQTCLQNLIDRMPPEILLKILSYLDALSLLSIGLVNKQFYEMAHNNGMWHKIYFAQYGQSKNWMPKPVDEVLEKLTAVVVQERPECYWRRLYFRTMAGYSERWRQELRDINPFTGLPSHTERVLRSQRVTWEITVCDKRGLEVTFQQSRTFFSDSSVTVCWGSRHWPALYQLSTLQLDGVKREALSSPNIINPYSVPKDKSPFDNADPYFGLHGYTVRIVLHNAVTQMMAGHFPRLSGRRRQVHGGFIQLNVISRGDESQHSPFSGRISLPWKCEAVEGTVENCCMMTLTLMDESHSPFWYVSTPVSMMLNIKEPSKYEGQHFVIKYQDAEGKMRMELVWMEEQRQYFLIGLVVFIATAKVNKHFGKAY